MNRLAYLAVLGVLAMSPAVVAAQTTAQASAAAVAVEGKMLYAADGKRLGQVYHVKSDGSAQVIIEGQLVTVPAATLSIVNGKLSTSLPKSQLLASL